MTVLQADTLPRTSQSESDTSSGEAPGPQEHRGADTSGGETLLLDEHSLVRLARVTVGDKLAGLVVDNLIGQMEIVIKSLGKYININRMISGATILGDGSVALIIDANTLV